MPVLDETVKKDIRPLVGLMSRCEQAPGYSTFQHGLDVMKNYKAISAYLGGAAWPFTAPPPKWIVEFGSSLRLHDALVSEVYTIYHDCGKWACWTVSAVTGESHFPNHAHTSKTVFDEYFNMPVAARLVGYDMVIHTASADQIDEFLKVWSVEDACTLMVSALAEIHANAKMFGGYDSLSFKVKNTHAAKRSMRICKALFS